MGQKRKEALGPNPLSNKRKQSKGIKKPEKPRRKRKGKRSKALCLQKVSEELVPSSV